MADHKRRFWQIHLSTAIVLMFAAGALVGANIVQRPVVHVRISIDEYGRELPRIYGITHCRYGWPCIMRELLPMRPEQDERVLPPFSESQTAEYNALYRPYQAIEMDLATFRQRAPSLAERIWFDNRQNVKEDFFTHGSWLMGGLIINGAVLVLLLLITLAVSERWLTRRRGHQP